MTGVRPRVLHDRRGPPPCDDAGNGSGLRGLSTAASLIPWAIVTVAIASALRATSRGLDLTDESLYIVLAVDPDLYLGMRSHAHLFWGVALDLVQTVRNLRVIKLEGEHNLLYVKGAIPGPRGGYVLVRKAVRS